MSCALHYLWGKIFWRSAKSISHFVASDLQLAETEVCQFYVALRVKNHIFRLKIPVNDPVSVEALECKNNLSCVKARPWLLKLSFFAQMEEKFASIQKVDHKIQSLWRLKCIMQLDNKGVVDSLQNHSLN